MQLLPDKASRILDIGCGTGLVGRLLKDNGYENLHGSDYAPDMVKKAGTFGVYETLEVHDITEAVEVADRFDASIAVGVFAFSVPNAEHLANVVNCNKPGGPALVTVNGKAWREKDWSEQLERFARNNPSIKIESIEEIDYLTAEGIDGRLLN